MLVNLVYGCNPTLISKEMLCYVMYFDWQQLIGQSRFVWRGTNRDYISEDEGLELFPISYWHNCK